MITTREYSVLIVVVALAILHITIFISINSLELKTESKAGKALLIHQKEHLVLRRSQQ